MNLLIHTSTPGPATLSLSPLRFEPFRNDLTPNIDLIINLIRNVTALENVCFENHFKAYFTSLKFQDLGPFLYTWQRHGGDEEEVQQRGWRFRNEKQKETAVNVFGQVLLPLELCVTQRGACVADRFDKHTLR